ncbi:GNAT family N-acetyltransferase [Bacillus sp. JJ1764]|uniref:GNAT family N-acetyltransferase n=1 Tax=Bacillus sp. JJ1764 TaxID=3122964 RepID=UPI003F689834
MNVLYTTKLPDNFEQVYQLYEGLGWNSLNFTVGELEKMCLQSWYVLYVYHEQQLVGMGRVISDGVITGVICGLGVLPSYQSMGIGKNIVTRLVAYCEQNRVIPQLMCGENLESYYEKLGFRKFTVGMNKDINR